MEPDHDGPPRPWKPHDVRPSTAATTILPPVPRPIPTGRASVNVVGQTLSFASLGGGGTVNEGGTASVSGTVSNLDGAAFNVTVVWGDGQSGDSDNGGQPFYFAAGTTSFSVNHYYSDPGNYTVVVTVSPTDAADTREAGGSVRTSPSMRWRRLCTSTRLSRPVRITTPTRSTRSVPTASVPIRGA